MSSEDLGLSLAREQLQAGAAAMAQRMVAGTLALEPGNAAAWDLLMDCAMAQGDTATALEALGSLTRLDPALAGAALARHGVVLTQIGRHLDGAERFDDLAFLSGLMLAADPHHLDALYLAATAARRCGRWDEAVSFYGRALERARENPLLTDLRLGLAVVLLERGELAAGLDMADLAVTGAPFYNPMAHRVYAEALRLNGRAEAARRAADWADRHEAFLTLVSRDLAWVPDSRPEPLPPHRRPASPALWGRLVRPGTLLRLALFGGSLALLIEAARG